jgi:hypothetical protein
MVAKGGIPGTAVAVGSSDCFGYIIGPLEFGLTVPKIEFMPIGQIIKKIIFHGASTTCIIIILPAGFGYR